MVKPTVVVIGCGPGGMSFCHAVETQRLKLLEANDEVGLASLPSVTCFESASDPGGVWRAQRSFVGGCDDSNGMDAASDEKVGGTANMYEALWTNGPKEDMEYFDHTFDEHFGGRPLPVYMPRRAVLEYILARVTKNCPSFFEEYVKFNTSITSVKYDKVTSKFLVTTHDHVADQVIDREFDKCIWAGGENGKARIPQSMLRLFRNGGFKGRIIHSSDTANFGADVKGKRIMLIGGSHSAVDLALTAVKEGVDKVFVCTRSAHGPITEHNAWPANKVEVLCEVIPTKVTNEGKCFHLDYVEYEFPNSYSIEEKDTATVTDIDTIIFCTGYEPNTNMLDEELRAKFEVNLEHKMEVPSNWKMKRNDVTDLLGDVEPGDVRMCVSGGEYSVTIYQGLMISNPSMMYLTSESLCDNPIVGADVMAWLFLAYIRGTTEIPTESQMRKLNHEEALRCMDLISLRYRMDRNYCDAYNKLYGVGDDERADNAFDESNNDDEARSIRILAKLMNDGKYPASYGSYDKLNEMGERVLYHGFLSWEHGDNLDPSDESENKWRTFRDYKNGEQFKSHFTGTAAAPSLKKHWLDITNEEMDALDVVERFPTEISPVKVSCDVDLLHQHVFEGEDELFFPQGIPSVKVPCAVCFRERRLSDEKRDEIDLLTDENFGRE